MGSRQPRIAVAGFLQETNTFVSTPTTHRDFSSASPTGRLYRGEEVLELCAFNTGVAGCAGILAQADIALVPLLWCEAEPGGIVADEAFERIMDELLGELRGVLPVDGVYLELHGAMVAESFDDAESEIVRRVQAVAGRDVPITCSLDLHGNITPELVDLCAGISAFRTFPHVDMRESGARATRQLLRAIQNGSSHVGTHRALPFLIPMYQQSTLGEPAASIYRELQRLEEESGGELDLSFLVGFYPADTYWTGPTILAYGPDTGTAQTAAGRLHEFIEAQRPRFAAPLYSVEEAVEVAAAHAGDRPLAIAEVQDNPGGGSPGDAMTLLTALHRAGVRGVAAAVIWDPQAIEFLEGVDVGSRCRLSLGGRHGFGEPLEAEFELLDRREGRFRGDGPMLGGTMMDIGRVAVLGLDGMRIVVSENRVQNLDQGFFTVAGIDPALERILVIKSSAHYRAHYGSIIDGFINVDTPGAYPADPAKLCFRKLRAGVARQAGPHTEGTAPGSELESMATGDPG